MAQPLKNVVSVLVLACIACGALYGGVHLRKSLSHLQKALITTDNAIKTVTASAPALTPPSGVWTEDPADVPNPQGPVTTTTQTVDDVSLILVEGGTAGTRRCLTRQGVEDFVREAGATAGINGTFFANKSIDSPDNLLIGPSLCGDEVSPTIGPFDRRSQLVGRPLILMSPNETKIVPYDADQLDDPTYIRAAMPTATDFFLGGVWLVHNGVGADSCRIAMYHLKDANDYRQRAFFGILDDGRPVLGATDCSVSSKQLSRALPKAGIREAVLLDSGFSTSLVCMGKLLVTGHTSPGVPSRPVPHAIVLFGNYTTASTGAGSAAG